VSTFIDRRAQIHQALMVGHLTPYDAAFVQQLAVAEAALRTHTDAVTAHTQALSLVYGRLVQQAGLWSFVEDFRLFGILCLVCLPMVLLFKKVKRGTKPIAAH
jgi:DHA2 family multidrug resistance protein